MRSGEKRPRLLKKGVCLFLMCAVFAGACAAYAQEPAGSGPSQEPVAAETRTEEPEAPAGPELAGFKTVSYTHLDVYKRQALQSFAAEAKSKSTFSSDVTVGAGDRIVTMVTCTYDFKNARYAVVGKLSEI